MTTEKQEAVDRLKSYLKPGDKVYTILRHVSRSGMTRRIDVVFIQDGERLYLTHLVGLACGYTSKGNGEGLIVSGCGSDMGFEVIYNLGRVLFPDGFGEKCREEGCTFRPSSQEEAKTCNASPEKFFTPHKFWGRNSDMSGWDSDGGYALKHQWL